MQRKENLIKLLSSLNKEDGLTFNKKIRMIKIGHLEIVVFS
jgi:hypothetical protein